MLIRSEFDIRFNLPCDTTMVALLQLRPELAPQLRSTDLLEVLSGTDADRQWLQTTAYFDVFGNLCQRFTAPAGALQLRGSNLLETSAEEDEEPRSMAADPVGDLPVEVLQFLLPSRYCEVDRFGAIAQDLFGSIPAGGERALAIRDWVHDRVRFDYMKARPTKTAMDVFTEREGVCRDFQHLAIALSRSLNMPARYVTGYLGDIRIPYGGVGDFSAWYQVWLAGRWWDMDARHNYPRLGRLLMAVGRDAADVAITTSFGRADLAHFSVESYEVDAAGQPVPLPVAASSEAPRLAPEVQAELQEREAE